MLGFLRNNITGPTRFVPTTAFCSPHADHGDWVALDARHGRVLLWDPMEVGMRVLVVWNPITDEHKELPVPPVWPLPQQTVSFAGAILCSAAAGTCDHLDCHRGPFLVVFMLSDIWTTFVCTYSSDGDAWSEIISSANPHDEFFVDSECTVLVGNDLYSGNEPTNIILKYNLESREMSWIQIPDECPEGQRYVLTTTEEGRLGLVTVIGSELYEWLRKDGHEAGAGWVQTRVIGLKTLLPFGSVIPLPRVAGFADGLGIVFLKFNKLLYTIDLKTNDVKKLCQDQGRGTSVVPYMSFYIPALEAACSEPDESHSVSACVHSPA